MYKYLTIIQLLESQIEIGDLQEGEKLPSIRALADMFECSHSTVIKALQELEKKHMVYSIPRSGYYVVKKNFTALSSVSDEIDFATSAPDWGQFPYVDFQHCINQAIDTYQQKLFIYGTPKGLPSLIDVVQNQLSTYQVFTKKENIFITSGVQQALFILTMLPFPNSNQKIVVEQPTYHLFIEHLKIQQVPVSTIKRAAKGIDLAELERIFSGGDIKFFYTMPRFHNPLGTSYMQKEKEAIIHLAEKYDVYIVEDDHLADFEQNSKADPIFSYDVNHRVIYLKSYSKIMFPGLRIGVAVLPEPLNEGFQQYKKIADVDSSMISQAALEIYIKSDMFEHHKNKVQLSYFNRAEQLYQSLEKHIPTDGIFEPVIRPVSICMNAHILLSKNVNVNRVIEKLKSQNVLLESVKHNYLPGIEQERILKFNVSNTNVQQIDRGIRLVVKEASDRRNWFV